MDTESVGRAAADGVEGRRLLARTLRPTTAALLDRLGSLDGLTCLDIGCGAGDVALELAQRVGPQGSVVGTDIDEASLALARTEAAARGLRQVEYRRVDIRTQALDAAFDVVYARWLLSHLSNPGAAIAACRRHLRPGGLLIVEDLDASGGFTWPDSKALRRARELYAVLVRTRGGNPDIGPQVPSLLARAGFEEVDVQVVQPAGLRGPVKSLPAIMLEHITDALIAERLATRTECLSLVREAYACARDPHLLISLPRIVQTWGRRRA